MYDNRIKHKFIELRAKGLNFGKTSNELDVSRQTLLGWSRKFESEIGNLKAIELDATKESAPDRISFGKAE